MCQGDLGITVDLMRRTLVRLRDSFNHETYSFLFPASMGNCDPGHRCAHV